MTQNKPSTWKYQNPIPLSKRKDNLRFIFGYSEPFPSEAKVYELAKDYCKAYEREREKIRRKRHQSMEKNPR